MLRTPWHCIALIGLLALAPLDAPSARQAIPPPDDGRAARIVDADMKGLGIEPGSGRIFEIDRRSHPALNRGWEAILAGALDDPALADLPDLRAMRILHREADWVLVWLREDDERALRQEGVRLNPPRPRPVEPRAFPLEKDALAPSLTLLQSLAAAVNIDRMMLHLDAIAKQIQTRYYNTTGMQSATQYVLDRFNEYGLDNAYFDTFTYNGYSIRNVVGVKTGSVYPNRIYMICGHLDSTSPQPSTNAPGAEDNGSGSVGVLEAARLLAPLTTESTVYFVCFTAEEQGLIGAEHLAAIADAQNWDLRGVLNMDMIGYDTAGAPDLWIEGFPSNPGSVALMNTLESVANAYTDMSVYRYPSTGWGSDHVPFNNHGFPALLAIDYDWEDYPCYHQTCDVVSNIVPNQQRRMTVAVTVSGAQLAVLTGSLGSVDGHADKTDSGDDSGVEIEIVGTQYEPGLSTIDGSFLLPDLLPGTYTLRASAVGYATEEVAVTIAGGQATPVTVLLDPVAGGRILGVVSLQGGGDPSGSRVFAGGQAAYAVAEATGGYVLEPVYPGVVPVSANHEGFMPAVTTVNIASGQEIAGVNFTLKPVWTFEDSSEGLTANAGWAWGVDTQAGAHSGTKVWGTRLGANYDNCADYRLDLPLLDLRFYDTARLHFWHWYRTEAGYDGGNVQVSTDGGSIWTVVTPVGGYPGALAGSCNPLAGQQGYPGIAASWREAIIDLGAYAGRAIKVRFCFGSDSNTRERGWYIDDISLEGALEPVGVPETPLPGVALLSGLAIYPNPVEAAATIRFQLAEGSRTWVGVFDAAGRKIRSLIDDLALPAGAQNLSWDGMDGSHHPVPAGVYWIQVFAGGRTVSSPVTLIR